MKSGDWNRRRGRAMIGGRDGWWWRIIWAYLSGNKCVLSVKRIIKPYLTPNYLLTCSQTMVALTWSSHCLRWMSDVGGWLCIPPPQSLTVCQRSLTTMQIQIQGLLQFSVPVFPTAEVSGLLTDYYTRRWSGVYHSFPFYALLYRETCWGSSDSWTPLSSVCTSWQPCLTAAGCTR